MDIHDKLLLIAIMKIHAAVSAQGILLCELAKFHRSDEVVSDVMRLTEANVSADEAIDRLKVYLS